MKPEFLEDLTIDNIDDYIREANEIKAYFDNLESPVDITDALEYRSKFLTIDNGKITLYVPTYKIETNCNKFNNYKDKDKIINLIKSLNFSDEVILREDADIVCEQNNVWPYTFLICCDIDKINIIKDEVIKQLNYIEVSFIIRPHYLYFTLCNVVKDGKIFPVKEF